MKRVLVIGCCGSGKSTFSKELSKKLNVPSVSLDRLFWNPGWVQRDKEDFDRLLQAELEKETWVIDGDYGRTLPHRLKYADTLIFLDFNRWLCTWRIVKRWLFQEGYQATGCPQKLDMPFLKYVFWDYPKDNRYRTLNIKEECTEDIKWIILNNPREAKKWISNKF